VLHRNSCVAQGWTLASTLCSRTRQHAPWCIPQTVEKAADERWTRRLALDERQLREGLVLRGNQARTRRFVQVCAPDAAAARCGEVLR